MKMELKNGDILEVSYRTPMSNLKEIDPLRVKGRF